MLRICHTHVHFRGTSTWSSDTVIPLSPHDAEIDWSRRPNRAQKYNIEVEGSVTILYLQKQNNKVYGCKCVDA